MKTIAQFSLAMAGAGFLGLMTVPKAYSLSLSYDSQIGAPGFAPGQLFVPQGIGVQDATGDVYVSNGRGLNPDGTFNANLGNRVDVFNAQGNYLRSVGSGRQGSGEGFDEPADLKFDPVTGDLHVGDVFNSEIDVYNPNTGEYIRSYGSFGGPVAGRIFFGPGGMSFGDDGNIYITDFSLDVIKVYNADSGQLVKTIGSSGTGLGQFQGPAGITVSPNTGRIYVNDQYNYRVQVFDPDGTPLFAFGEKGSALGQLREGIGLEVDEYENIYIADSQNSRVQVFDKNGNFLTTFGTPAAASPPALGEPPFGNPLDLTPGTFNWTAGLHYDDSKLYVGDFFQGRVQVLNVSDAAPPDPSTTVPEPSSLLGLIGYALSAIFVNKFRKQK
ncbi:PEP-CTERM sorting domain-containing beta-propeller repeat protein [Aphanothece hegewaldii CCALA 016]|uniref:PEP-CTERM sorting domain-containing beta-propeller repeat protein n=1 Tax=Aphanothece hegewaldii CCALA 016 TaxID=2107694 RepID=A0A2T1M1D1_9CHRO|nr:scytonemin biosynthesis PEP-CTERM protein ScyF [Aphanothece hegewaldii]PSF38500.1 PEP-CTERM sorting domain-containing beta-propeller repeat protein [Aphanothece hegewaldii CCALA 016]